MADEPINSAPLDLDTGEVVYKGVTYTFKEFEDLWENESYDLQDAAENLRDFTRDDQNLWGSKKNRFADDWWKRKSPQRRVRGYPRDLT